MRWKKSWLDKTYTYDGVRRVSGLRMEPAVSVEDLTYICVSHWKVDSDPLVGNLCGLIISYFVRNTHKFLTRGTEWTFQWDTQICVRSSTETVGSLRDPETRRTPSYVCPVPLNAKVLNLILNIFNIIWEVNWFSLNISCTKCTYM